MTSLETHALVELGPEEAGETMGGIGPIGLGLAWAGIAMAGWKWGWENLGPALNEHF